MKRERFADSKIFCIACNEVEGGDGHVDGFELFLYFCNGCVRLGL